jgi:hypothetical protein
MATTRKTRSQGAAEAIGPNHPIGKGDRDYLDVEKEVSEAKGGL